MVFRRERFSRSLSLLMPTFAFPSAPPRLTARLHRRTGCSPTDACASHGFGGLLMPVHHPRPPARLVSCYALFERMAASKPTSQLSVQADLVKTTQEALGGLGRWSGFFPSRARTLAPAPSLPGCTPRHSEFGWGRQAAKPPRPSSISTSAEQRPRLPLKAFRGVRAISQLDWPFTPTPSSSEHFST